VYEEGLEQRFSRHRLHAELLWEGLEALGLTIHVPLEHRLPCLTTPYIPEGVDDLEIRRRLLNEYNIEIAGGFGQLAGAVWRIGVMGYSSRKENVVLLLSALRDLMR
jgi:alanine-glyoxylate transaminase/serine-glyoxylate transaminase/serine-pyruvate transaminase